MESDVWPKTLTSLSSSCLFQNDVQQKHILLFGHVAMNKGISTKLSFLPLLSVFSLRKAAVLQEFPSPGPRDCGSHCRTAPPRRSLCQTLPYARLPRPLGRPIQSQEGRHSQVAECWPGRNAERDGEISC